MPTYEYRCDACDHLFEEFQSMSAKPLRKCPACGKRRLRRLFGAGAGIIFKGSGFYETDYRRKTGGPTDAEKAGRKAESEAKSKGESKPESKPDAKPAPKPEAKPAAAKKDGKKRG